MVVKGFPLIKFQSRELIESLQNGLIYMNSLVLRPSQPDLQLI